ncbi:uncharacterized protein LOC113450677 [Pseudonaja textilis]|uniref:uncharacterized protein LOC113450677 n=1 Tax=Pseudonaja textilis TaxID=8673 RepID=UPI000EAAC58D|nr:uncharacterized protein LOC113450677 [Pseudonaja textilis]
MLYMGICLCNSLSNSFPMPFDIVEARYKRVQEDGHPEVLQRERLRCGEEGRPRLELAGVVLFWMNLGADIPPPPVLKLDPLSQRVKEGDCLLLLCSAKGSNTKKKFHFYKEEVEIIEGPLEPSTEPTSPLQNASLRIPHASINHSGEFACRYEEKTSNRWIMSSWSQRLNISVWTRNSDPVGTYAWTVILLIILLVPFAFYCWKKKKNRLEVKEPNEEKEEHGKRHRQTEAAAVAPVKESEVIYSACRVSSSLSSLGPVMEDHFPPQKEGTVLYSDLLFLQTARKHAAY